MSSPTISVVAGGLDIDSSSATIHLTRRAHAFSRDGSSTESRERPTERTARADMIEMAESALINGTGMSSENFNGRPADRVIVKFSKCHDIEGLFSCPCGHGYG
jgi:hypothetical protein